MLTWNLRSSQLLRRVRFSEGFNKFTHANVNTLLLCTNQLRAKVGIAYGRPDEMPGGRAQRYYASYILELRNRGWLTEDGQRVGYNIGIRTLKNKLAAPHQEAVIPFLFTGAVDTVAGFGGYGIGFEYN